MAAVNPVNQSMPSAARSRMVLCPISSMLGRAHEDKTNRMANAQQSLKTRAIHSPKDYETQA
jgi:hypothetical protein